jgi:solute carrier family 25, member 38
MTSLTYVRSIMATSPHFSKIKNIQSSTAKHSSVLPTLTNQGNLIAGAATRVSLGLALNPLTVLKARYEVRLQFSTLALAFDSLCLLVVRATCTRTRLWFLP